MANKYEITTEDRGHGIIAVYVTGPADEYDAIERAGKAYARKNLTFEPGLSGRPVSSGASFTDAGMTVTTQQIFITKRLAPRED